ncbi:MAG: copper chaperone PCu(A)C [Pikeienuella sp.]
MKSLLLSAAFVAASAVGAFAADVMAVNPYSFASPKLAKAGAVFVSLVNHGSADRLVDARSDAAKRVQLHESVQDGDVMRMRHLHDGLELPMHGQVDLAPGGYHIMLMGLTQPLVVGEEVRVTLTFENAGEMEIVAPIRERGAAGGHSTHKHSE